MIGIPYKKKIFVYIGTSVHSFTVVECGMWINGFMNFMKRKLKNFVCHFSFPLITV